ncbi:MAG: Tat (twin-arginine translocation) pathway signal sequence domain protein, partial [Rhodospirillales bacterium]|nr:Tat (twin-arginine translocation) pathway signal sequence domain protein [Rhodospirillales bacterium]
MASKKIDRRNFLSFTAAAGALAFAPRLSFAASAQTERRFIFVIQRGAADGLEIAPPVGDPEYARIRPTLALDPAGVTKLDGTFGLHPALVETAKMYQAGEVLLVHAVASPYRDRSHFDGQNVMECGGSSPYSVHDGWMNRLATLLPKTRTPPTAFAPTVPMALRGPARVTSYAPS